MTLEALVVNEAARHIAEYGFVKNMDSMALHILKTSQRPIVASFRDWMRRTALQQAQQAEREQKKMNDEFAHTEYARKSQIRRSAVIHPYYASKAVQQGESWNDGKFVQKLKRDNPRCFPVRDAR